MTILQLAHRLASNYLSVPQFAALPADRQLMLLDAIHTGFGGYFASVPLRYREKHIGMRFGGTSTGTVTVTVGSRTATFAGVTPVDGASVEIAEDDITNRVTLSGAVWSLEIPYGGSTSGSKAVTVYKDVQVISWEIASFVSSPRDARNESFELLPVPAGAHVWPVEWSSPAIGYRLERTPNNTIMRVIPAPEADLPVSAVCEVENISIGGIEGLTVAGSQVPVSDDHCTRLVLPLCAEALLTHPDWKLPALERSVRLAADRARADIRLLKGKVTYGPNTIEAPFP